MRDPRFLGLDVSEFGTTLGADRLYRWLATSGLEIVLWALTAAILIRCINWAGRRYAARIEAQFQGSDQLVQSEQSKHRRAVVQVFCWVLITIVILICGLRVLGIIGVPVTGLIGPGAVLGAALGFGAQRVVQDLLAGFFIVTERQYGYGDVVTLAVTGSTEPAEGTVEDVTLRVTKLRTGEGEVVTVPNGQIVKATNLSKDWARAVVDIPIPAEADIGKANEVLEQVGTSFYEEPEFHPLLLDAPSPLGVIDIELDSITIRMVARTLPGKQFEISRRLRVRIISRLAAEGITIAPGREVQSDYAPPATLGPDTGGQERGDSHA